MDSLEVLLAVALIPPIVLLFLIWKVDKLEHEPIRLLLLVVGLGAASGVVALVLEIALDGPIQTMFQNNYPMYLIVDNFIGVALMEEISKGLAVFFVVWRHKEFNCRFDGVVYGAASALGFAALENVKYTLSYGLGTGLVRAVTAIPGHFIFGVFMGAMVGIAKCAKYDGNQGKKMLFLVLALLIPTLLHGYYDYLLSVPAYMGDTEGIWIIYLLGMFVAAAIVIIRMAKHDRLIDKNADVNGVALPAASTATAAAAIPGYGVTGTQSIPAGQVSYTPGAYVPGQGYVGTPTAAGTGAQAYAPVPQAASTSATYTAPKTPVGQPRQ